MMDSRVIIMVAIMSVVTMATRFLPFLIFRNGKETPDSIAYLGKVLPCAIMGMLVVFCLKNVSLVESPHGFPELIACATVVGLHVWKRNTLVSILGGTLVYMFLVQQVFL